MAYDVIVSNKNYNGLNPILFGYEQCLKHQTFGPTIRGYYLIHYVVSGIGYFTINNREYKVKAGEMFVIPPFKEAFYRADSENPWYYIFIGFTTDSELPIPLNDTIHCPKALKIFNDMKYCEKNYLGRSAYLSARLWDLFALLLENSKEDVDVIEKATDCIHAEYMTDLTVEKLAMRLNLDRSYFSTLFKKKTGMSPKQYLFNYRMNVASSLLIHEKKSISVTAYSVGYTDIFNFSKMFKKHFGLSPRDYIKQNRK